MAAQTLTTWNLVAETREWVGPITVTADGAPVTNFKVAVTEGQTRPTTFSDPYDLPQAVGQPSRYGVMVGLGTDYPLKVGKQYTIWVQFSDVPEQPVERVGQIKVT